MHTLYTPVPPTVKNPLQFGLACPGDARIALSSLGYLTLFRQLDEHPAVAAMRLDMETIADAPVHDLDLLGVSFPFELDILNIFKLFDAAQVPYLSKDRGSKAFPLIFAGGPVPTSNPEPYADFFDFFLIGDGEPAFDALITLASRDDFRAADKPEQLARIAQHVAGAYVPSRVNIDYEPYGLGVTSIESLDSLPIIKASVNEGERIRDLSSPENHMNRWIASSPMITGESYFPDTFLVEIQRGCAHRCRFCLASYTTLPTQAASLDILKKTILAGLEHTNKIGLLGALVSEHPEFGQLCNWLNQQMQTRPEIQLSVASLRADTLTPDIAATMAKGGQKQLTIAIESGSEGLRRRIHKNLTTEAIIQAAKNAASGGIKSLKLYSMVGLPTETEADVLETAQLLKSIRKQVPHLRLTLGCSTFVPKAATPFQWQARLDGRQLKKRIGLLQKHLSGMADFHPSSARWDTVQALLSRGDRRLGSVLVAWHQASLSHHNKSEPQRGSLSGLKQAWRNLEIPLKLPSMSAMAQAERSVEAALPWDMLSLGVSKAILAEEARISLSR
ncbi:MAG: radical SAM protein [Vampirovibrionales bacterium]|nr:radical SAM protein [Vampirovibrionales bacterium]